ncbi:MAG: hypothetical protein O9326_24390 [Microcystis sp. LE19-338.1B]|nr:hypothetical protein [Microcystis sp. LE19-338.1B]MCZ8357952.1 hypothetical protein [Microcystis sp. LE19-388.1G]
MKTLELDRGLNFILSEKAFGRQLSVISNQLFSPLSRIPTPPTLG